MMTVWKFVGVVALGVLLSGCADTTDDDTVASNAATTTTLAAAGGDASTAAAKPNIVALAQSVAGLSTLVTAVTKAELVDTMSGAGTFTVFAPNNAAFVKLGNATLDNLLLPANKAQLADILKYHVLATKVLSTDLKASQSPTTLQGQTISVKVDGGAVSVNDAATVVTADQMASNGVVHIIDTVLTLPAGGTATTTTTAGTPNIVELAQSVSTLSTLVQAVVAADLVNTLSGAGTFTVFAPNDAAFDKLEDGTLANLLLPENKAQLVDILTYHVLATQVLSTNLAATQSPATVQGQTILVKVDGGGAVSVNDDATVVTADQMASNGVVHIIDKVLMLPVTTTTTTPAL